MREGSLPRSCESADLWPGRGRVPGVADGAPEVEAAPGVVAESGVAVVPGVVAAPGVAAVPGVVAEPGVAAVPGVAAEPGVAGVIPVVPGVAGGVPGVSGVVGGVRREPGPFPRRSDGVPGVSPGRADEDLSMPGARAARSGFVEGLPSGAVPGGVVAGSAGAPVGSWAPGRPRRLPPGVSPGRAVGLSVPGVGMARSGLVEGVPSGTAPGAAVTGASGAPLGSLAPGRSRRLPPGESGRSPPGRPGRSAPGRSDLRVAGFSGSPGVAAAGGAPGTAVSGAGVADFGASGLSSSEEGAEV